MLGISNILKKLNIMEQNQLNKYIFSEVGKQTAVINQVAEQSVKEREEALLKANENAWQVINDNITLALRENKVSMERINAVYKRVYELTNSSPHVRLINLPGQPSKDFEILSKDEYRDLIEELMEGHCKGCMNHSKECNIYKLLKKHNIPYSGQKGKCKYAYKVEFKKKVG